MDEEQLKTLLQCVGNIVLDDDDFSILYMKVCIILH
jgi:hypothetical protein